MDIQQLQKVGLSKSEAIIYLSLLKLGISSVKIISKECGFHRTNIYDTLEQLKEKGLISFHKEGKTTMYKANDPENLIDYLKEKEQHLRFLLPDLQKLKEISKEAIEVEVFKGEEGMKSLFRSILKEKKPLYMFGVRGQFREIMPEYSKQWFREVIRLKLPLYGIYTGRDTVPPYYTQVRFVSEKLNSPVATFIFGNKVCINIWSPALLAIVIKSKDVAKTYKDYFDILWHVAKK